MDEVFDDQNGLDENGYRDENQIDHGKEVFEDEVKTRHKALACEGRRNLWEGLNEMKQQIEQGEVDVAIDAVVIDHFEINWAK